MSRLVVLVVGLGLCGLAGGCSNMSGNHQQNVAEWVNGASYHSLLAQLNDDLGFLVRATRARDLAGLRTDCAGFTTDSQTIYGTLPTPDVALTNDLNDSMTDFAAAFNDCTLANAFSSTHFRHYASELARAERELDAATKRLAALGVR